MPNMPGIYTANSDSDAGGGNTPATPATGAPTEPDAELAQTTSTAPAAAPELSPVDTTPGELTPTERKIKGENWGTAVYHGVLSALGGGGDVSYTRTPDGKMVATPVATGPGTQWKKIIAGAITGFAAGAQAGGTGPGSTMRAAGAATGAGMKLGAGRDQAAREHADQDFDAAQKAATQQAQTALLNHHIAQSVFELGRAQVTAAVEDSERESNFEKVIGDGGDGSRDLGVFPDFQSVIKAFNDVPELHSHQAGGRIVSIPHINGQGKVDGVHAALVSPDWLNSKINRDLPLTVRTFKDGKVEESTFTVPAGSLTGQQYANMVQAQSKDAIEDWTKKADANAKTSDADSRAKLVPSEIRKNDAEAAKDRAETATGNTNPEVKNDIAEGLASGRYLMGKDIPLRTSKDQTTAAEYNRAADAYSRANYGLPYSPEIVRQEAHFANSPKTQAFLLGIDRMMGTPGLPGQLDQVLDLARRAKLGNSAPLNELKLWVKQTLGDVAVKNLEQGMSDTQTALGTLIGNPMLGSGESDLKLKTAQHQFGSNPTLENLVGAVSTTKEILGRARREMARNNRYIQQRYGDDFSPRSQQQPGQQPPGQQPQGPPAGATKKVPGPDGKTHWTNDLGTVDYGVAQ